MRKTVVHAVLCLFALFVAGAAAAASPEPTPTPVPPPHLDTILDINASTIVASLVGCDAKKGDKVLVNGQPQDNAHWDLRSLTPSEEKPLNAADARAVSSLMPSKPRTLPDLQLRILEGYYESLTISVGDCTFGPIPLIADGTRHVTLLRSKLVSENKDISAPVAGVFGDIPLPDLQVTLTGGPLRETLAARNETNLNMFGDIYSYYFDAVKPGRYTLTVHGFGWSKTLGDVFVDRPGARVLRYIHPDEIGLPGR
jgi:hypothetical protein